MPRDLSEEEYCERGVPTTLLGDPFQKWTVKILKDYLVSCGVTGVGNAPKVDLMLALDLLQSSCYHDDRRNSGVQGRLFVARSIG